MNVWDADIDFDLVGRTRFGEDGGEEGRANRFRVYIEGVIGDGVVFSAGLLELASSCWEESSKFRRAEYNRARIYTKLFFKLDPDAHLTSESIPVRTT